MKFWIVTPSYNQLEWLKLCIASVADQAGDGIEVHHHVQDACSSDGTREFLADHLANSQQLLANGYTFSYESAPDDGMYDAINRGWKLASEDVDVVAHLNCDEQYLPGALKSVADFFMNNAETEVLLADMIVVDTNGDYICHRRSLKPYPMISKFHCAGFTATTFHRLSVTRDKQVFFDTRWRNIGDKVWYNALHDARCSFGIMHRLVSLFTETGDNLNWTENALVEGKQYREEYLKGISRIRHFVSKINGLRRYILEFFHKPPAFYALYEKGKDGRTVYRIKNPTGMWHKKGYRPAS
jgi:glycosyltransferase involved in cell wall biosynthesis